MNMKEMCERFVSALEDCITDSFYDDDGGDFVELYIESLLDPKMKIQIEIDTEYFGFSCLDYDETYGYDEYAEENYNEIIRKIRKLMSGELCVILFYGSGRNFYNILEESNRADESFIKNYISNLYDNISLCYAEKYVWNESVCEVFRFN